MSTYPIIPSLSRAPDFATTRKIDDGTLRSPKESGYVTTRPRFTRLRRVFGVTWKNLCAEDIRVLDKFETLTVQGGAGAFYLPNLVANGQFEFPATLAGEVFSGWFWAANSAPFVAQVGLAPDDGKYALGFVLTAATVPVGNGPSNVAQSTSSFPVDIGDVLLFSLRVRAGNPVTGVSIAVVQSITVTYSDGTTQGLSGAGELVSEAFFATYTNQFTVPAGAAYVSAVSAVVAVGMFIVNATSAPVTIAAGTGYLIVDSAGVALVSAGQPYGKMPGTSSPGNAVRFTKPLDIRDTKWGSGQTRYDVTAEVMEI